MASLRTVARLGGSTLAILAAACTGQLGGSDAVDGDPNQQDGPGAVPVDDGGQPLTVQPIVVGRLNRLEYNNTVRDLLGTALRPADGFPSDGMAGGFTTVGSALSLSPTYVSAYESAAHDLIRELFAGSAAQRVALLHCDVEEGDAEAGVGCARSILEGFAPRAWRRPATENEIDAVLLPYRTAQKVGATRTMGLEHSLAAVLMSPLFLFKLEVDDDPRSTEPRTLNPYELASRLSYALWSTMPDDKLMAAAAAGQLVTDDQVAAQIDRMLEDPRAEALLENFAARWLEFDRLETHEVEASVFPEFSSDLAASMGREARAFVQEFLRSGRPAAEMLTAGFTHVDARLAAYYGAPFPGDAPDTLVRIETAGTERIGLLTLGALLTTTSFSSRTSAVRRGEFVFSHLLCESIPPPPPGVEGLPADETSNLTLRERLELHRADPSCAGCHNVMDPLGFGLEHYDAIGRYRTLDGTSPVDASGELPDGTSFDGAAELSGLLSRRPSTPQLR